MNPSIFIMYGVFIFLYLIFSVAGIYHLWRFGYTGDLSRPVAVIYVLISAVIIIATITIVSLRSVGI